MITKQYASVTPQAISVWCRRRGHETFYATYCGAGDPRRLLPRDLDVVFIATLHAGERDRLRARRGSTGATAPGP